MHSITEPKCNPFFFLKKIEKKELQKRPCKKMSCCYQEAITNFYCFYQFLVLFLCLSSLHMLFVLLVAEGISEASSVYHSDIFSHAVESCVYQEAG